VASLARSAEQIAADNSALDELACDFLDKSARMTVEALLTLAPAVRTRVLHAWAKRLGAPGGALSHRHVEALDALVTAWRGQGAVHLPGGIRVAREGGTLVRVP
jgi:tRNA(Ile)-lysidine synthase